MEIMIWFHGIQKKLINLKKKLEEDKNNFENLYIEFVNNSEQKLKKGIYLNKKN